MDVLFEDLSRYDLDELEETKRAAAKLMDVDFNVYILSNDFSARLRKLLRELNAEILKRKEAANA